MKKLLLVLAIAGFATACNNDSESKDTKKDSLDKIDSAAREKKENIDSAADKMKDKVDSLADKKKDSIKDKM